MNNHLRMTLRILISLFYGLVVLAVGTILTIVLVDFTRFTYSYYINILAGLSTIIMTPTVIIFALRGWGMPSKLRKPNTSSDNNEREE